MAKKQLVRIEYAMPKNADADKAIAAAIKSAASAQKAIHSALMLTMAYMARDKDLETGARRVNALIDGLSKGSQRVNAIRAWAEGYMGFVFNAETKQMVTAKRPGFTYDLASANGNPFWEYAPEPEYKPMDWNAALKQIIAKAKADVNKLHDKSSVNGKQLMAIEALLNAKDAEQ